jgi:urease accessory protein
MPTTKEMSPADAPEDLESLLDLLHLSSLALPVGSFAYSQGLEQAIESRVIVDYQSAHRWITDCLSMSLGRQEGMLWRRVFDAAAAGDTDQLVLLNTQIFALKETSELRLESLQMGQSLAHLFSKWPKAAWLSQIHPTPVGWTHTAAHASLCAAIGLSAQRGAFGFLWSWCENQVLCIVKHLPLGQTDGQRLLSDIKPVICRVSDEIFSDENQDFGSAAFGFAINSARHETLYSRLFRS